MIENLPNYNRDGSPKPIAAFDFDGTLIAGDSFLMFARHALPMGRLVKAAFQAVPVILRWKTGLIGSSKAKELIFGYFFRNYKVNDLKAKAESFIAKLDKRANPEVMAELQKRTASMEWDCIIISASQGFWIRPWAERHRVSLVIATEAQVTGNRLTGRFSTPNCKGEEKVRRLLEAYPDLEDHYLECWGNAPDDLPLLSRADKGHLI